MKIAIVAPSPVPFTIGGIENLSWGLCEWMNQNTEHQVELIKLPSREFDFWSLIETYKNFYSLNLDHFDMVISVKYPTWMIRHRNHICYMAHRLRGLYDTYHFTKCPTEVQRGNPDVDKILDYMEKNKQVEDLDPFFVMLEELQSKKNSIPKNYFDFPAPFIRAIIHFMDNYALSKKKIKKFFSISNTVKKRAEYFPSNSSVEVVYPPSNLKKYGIGEYKYVFMMSRLDSPKRINLLVEAMKYVNSDIHLYIAGTGPEEKNLKKIAGDDERIHFLGFVTDEEAEAYYRDSLVIPYFPYDEDYGFITIEAMMHKKPVITTNDAGGPTEFVENGETGFIVAPKAAEIAEKIDFYANHRDEAKRMGENAYKKVCEITWDKVCNTILGGEVRAENKARKKILVTTTFPIYPPMGGGQARIYNIYKEIAKDFDVCIVSLVANPKDEFEGYIAPNLYEKRVSKSEKHAEAEMNLEMKIGVPVTDVAMLSMGNLSERYVDAVEQSAINADIVIASHPYTWAIIKKYVKEKDIIYEAHNVEYLMKKSMFPDNSTAKEQLQIVFDAEKECCEQGRFIMACSDEDCEKLAEIYGVSKEKIIIVPNGVDTSNTEYVPYEKRLANKKALGLEKEKLALFMGSWHKPNLEACEEIMKFAHKCKDTKFLLLGSQCEFFRNKKNPENVGLLGMVDESIKNKIFGIVDFALNPMMSGSGTNLKMFDYMAAGIPVISTEFGTRGIEDKSLFTLTDVESMPDAINGFDKNNSILVESARKYVEENFDWQIIAQKLQKKL